MQITSCKGKDCQQQQDAHVGSASIIFATLLNVIDIISVC